MLAKSKELLQQAAPALPKPAAPEAAARSPAPPAHKEAPAAPAPVAEAPAALQAGDGASHYAVERTEYRAVNHAAHASPAPAEAPPVD